MNSLYLQHSFRKETAKTKISEASRAKELVFAQAMEQMISTGVPVVPKNNNDKYHVTPTYLKKVVDFLQDRIAEVAKLFNVSGRLDPNGSYHLAIKNYYSSMKKSPPSNNYAVDEAGFRTLITNDCFCTKKDLRVMFDYYQALLVRATQDLFSFRSRNSKTAKEHKTDRTGGYQLHIISRDNLASLVKYGMEIPKKEEGSKKRSPATILSDKSVNKMVPAGDGMYTIQQRYLSALFGNAFYNTGSERRYEIKGRSKPEIYYSMTKFSKAFAGNTTLVRSGDQNTHKIIPEDPVSAATVLAEAAKGANRSKGVKEEYVNRMVAASAIKSLIAPPTKISSVDAAYQEDFSQMVNNAEELGANLAKMLKDKFKERKEFF
uniref:Uncharacterized protein n=1 Tax=viral metagenome TaxID=1070528 RepID=A0A6C0JXZ8_9ZZZZ